jgi:hypothetical protein
MKTYPEYRDDGALWGFEIQQTWVWIGTILRILRSVPGVSNVQRASGDDRRVLFTLNSEPCIVLEPFGDNSRYWIGPEHPKTSALDLTSLHAEFASHRSPIMKLLSRNV